MTEPTREATTPDADAAASTTTPPVGAPPPPAASGHGGLALRITLPVAIVAALLAVFWPREIGKGAAPGGTPLDIQGRPAPIAERMAPVTLVHFWATWCPPCITEVPLLVALERDLHLEPDFRLLFIAVEDEAEKISTFLGPDLVTTSLLDPNWDTAKRWGTNKLPETYLVVDGNIVERWVGAADWSDPAIRQRLAQALEQVKSGKS